MSGQWEIVGKKKDKNIKVIPNKPNKDKKKQPSNGPKVEDILPEHQVKNLYLSGKNNKENKPQEKTKKPDVNIKKPQKKPEKQPETVKPKPPKSIESALTSINVEEFKNLYESTRTLFPDAPIVWLKELAHFLNQKVPVDIQDPVFTNKAEYYPLSLVPVTIKSVLEKTVKEAGKENVQIFYDICLTAMATDMGKGLSALGYKFFLQQLAHNDPKIVITNLSKHVVLRNSYQNRQQIGLSILWALGQGGIRDFNVGFKVFQEIMLPLIEMKNYSRYIVLYLVDLINRYNDVPLTKDQYIVIMDIIYSNKKNFPTDLNKTLYKVVPKLKVLLFTNNNDKYNGFMEPLLKKLSSNSNNAYRNELCDVIVTCIKKDQTCFNSWSKNYTKYLVSSGILLSYIDDNWKSVSKNFNKETFFDLLKTYSVTNDELMLKKRKDDGLLESNAAIKKLSSKMTTKKGTGFPFKTSLLVLILSVGVLVFYDIRKEGSWEKSRTLKGLNDSGLYDYVNKASNRAKEGAIWVRERIDEKFPGCSEKVIEFSGPYVTLARQLILVAYNVMNNMKDIAVAKYPIFLESFDTYAPGFIKQSLKIVQNGWTTSALYFNRSIDYLKTEIFVGHLAPEYMHMVVMDALNRTQHKASEYYHWLYEKVQTSIK